jgi:hypothetical protein
MTSDAATFNGVRGTTPPPDEFLFLVDPIALRRSARTNNAGMTATYNPNPTSTVSFNATHTLRNYGGDAVFRGSLSDQQNISGSLSYTHRTAARDEWTLGYTGAYYSFQDFQNALSHALRVGYTATFAADLRMQITAGASHVENPGATGNYISYDTTARLDKTAANNTFSLYYVQTTGQPTGLGSVSDTRRAGVAVRRLIGLALVFVDAYAFDARGRLDNPLETRGVSTSASIGFPLTETISVHGGIQYQRYDQANLLEFDRKRVFASMRYNNPAFWTFFR